MGRRMATFLERIHLEIIQAVDQHGSLTAAAERLHLTQPALPVANAAPCASAWNATRAINGC